MEYVWEKFLSDSNGKLTFLTPIVLDKDNKYYNHVKKLLKEIEKKLISLEAPEIFISITREFSDRIVNCIQKYYEGDLFESCNQMKIIIQQFEKDGLTISRISNSISFNYPYYYIEPNRNRLKNIEFYRARYSDSITTYKSTEMLHVPFDQREKVSSGRFSIPGLPCLYLGSTSYCCWLEMGNPAEHNFNVSLLYLKQDYKVLNLTVNSGLLYEESKNLEISSLEMQKLFKLWLLTLVTSYKIKQEGRNFKSEYIVSQMIMLACKKRGIDGVAFLSKQLKNDNFAVRTCVNLALLPTYNYGKALSKMCKDLIVTDSFNYSMYKQLTYGATYQMPHLHIDDSLISLGIAEFYLPFAYQDTYFYRFDKFLKSIFLKQ